MTWDRARPALGTGCHVGVNGDARAGNPRRATCAMLAASTSPKDGTVVLSLARRTLRRTLFGRGVRVWHHPAYRLPLGNMEGNRGMEPRRADLVRWFCLESGVLTQKHLKTPQLVGWDVLSRVHTASYLETMATPEGLGQVFSVPASEVEVEPLLSMSRLAVGGTVEAAFEALSQSGPMVNLLGGFHHAFPEKGGGFCPFNDIAVAISGLRELGWRGRVNVLDLDAHPPDGTAACVAADSHVWVGSLSASNWGTLDRVDETVLPPGTGNAGYLRALDGLLRRMPRAALTFVLAGGDVLEGDRFGKLALTLEGALQRDQKVLHALHGQASVWVPAGGYHDDSWKVLAQTVELLVTHQVERLPPRLDPLSLRFAAVASRLSRETLQGDAWFSMDDVEASLGMHRAANPRLLGFYTAEGVEHALFRYGMLTHLHRLGYTELKVGVECASAGDSLRVTGEFGGARHLLIEVVVEKRTLGERGVLFINWLELSHPRASFSPTRPQLPGQRVPGLGLAPEATEMLLQMARRLGLQGVMLRPAHLHVAYALRHRFRFVDPERQGRFVALLRDRGNVPLLNATRAVSEGRVKLNGKPYAWEPDNMVLWLDQPTEVHPNVEQAAAQSHFTFD